MLITDLLQEAISAISANKFRSGLTILGIVIGIGSVIAMVSIGQGASSSIEEGVQSMGSNLITVLPGTLKSVMQVSKGRGTAETITTEDAEAIAQEVNYIKAVAPEISNKYQVVAKGANTNVRVIGTNDAYPEVRNVEMDLGAFVSDRDLRSLSKVAILGPVTRDDLFGEEANPIGEIIRINNIIFRVIGITERKGGTALGSQDDMVFIPITTAQQFLSGANYVSSINIQAENSQSMALAQSNITDFLLRQYSVDDFSVVNQQDVVGMATETTNTLTILLAAIAGISLLVGGIGIMNMMMTSVTERTREIGLRKAIGAKKREISRQFLAEAVMLTFLGGVIGIILGSGTAYGITFFTGTATEISLFSIILAFGVSAGIGIGFGFWPAQKAAKLNPIEALRYE